MSSKNNPGPFNCYAAAMPDENIFTVLARDPAYPATLDFWRAERVRQGKADTEDDIARLASIAHEIKTGREWREINLHGPDGEPTWRTKMSFVTDDTRPIRVEDAAMEVSIKDTFERILAILASEMMTQGTRDTLISSLCSRAIDAIDANVPCVPTMWEAGEMTPTYDRPVRDRTQAYNETTEANLTRGERMVLDDAPLDLAHKPEVPQHRFSMFNKGEHYAYARGLEINPSHLPLALDAMHLDGWELVSLFGQTDAEHVGFVFKRRPEQVIVDFGTQSAEEQERLRKYMTARPDWRFPGTKVIFDEPDHYRKGPVNPGARFTPPKVEVHVEGMAAADAIQIMSVIECRLQWLPQDYEQVQIVGLIANEPEAAFDFVQHRGRLEKRKTLIKGNCGATEFGRQQEP